MENKKLGFWSSFFALVFGMLFNAALVLTLAGVLKKPWDTFWQLLPSIFLAWSYMVMMLCLFKAAERKKSIWALAGAGFAIVYATINSIVYFTVLTLVFPAMLDGRSGDMSLLLFEPGKFLFHINGLAYTLMSVAALLSMNSFLTKGRESFLRYAMLAHGLIAPFIGGAVVFPALAYAGALWMVTFPVMGAASMMYFKTKR